MTTMRFRGHAHPRIKTTTTVDAGGGGGEGLRWLLPRVFKRCSIKAPISVYNYKS